MTLESTRDSLVAHAFCSVVTAPARGAIAVVKVWGPGSLAVADRAFRPHRGTGLAGSPVGRLRVGRVGAGLGDEVVGVVVEATEVEFQCHGGPAAVALVVEALVEAGAKVRGPRAWAIRARGSILKGEAELALASAPTLKSAAILLDQAGGALDDALRRVLDLPDESALTKLDHLIELGGFGTRLVEGWRVVLAGRPNVGKSRLLNALAGYDRAIVASSPGTTRDVVTVRTAFAGWPVEIADTAGLRAASDPIERQGMALARTRQREADLVIVVLDRSEPLDDLDRAVLLEHPASLVVANKADLPAAWEASSQGALAVSADRGDGLELLVKTVAMRLVPEPPPQGAALPFLEGQVQRLCLIRELIKGGALPERTGRSSDGSGLGRKNDPG